MLILFLIFSIFLILPLIIYIQKIIFSEINYCKQKPYDTRFLTTGYGNLIASFYTFYANRWSGFTYSNHDIKNFFSNRGLPVKVEIYEDKMLIYNGLKTILIGKDRVINLKCIPLTNTANGMFYLYGEKLSVPALYRHYYQSIYITDVIGDDVNDKLILSPMLADIIKENFEVKETILNY